jgi:hypothetical protein
VSDNHHFDRAKSRLHNGTTNEVARAQAEAALALTYEQRTANLIAIAASHRIMAGVDYAIVIEQIKERLGLE